VSHRILTLAVSFVLFSMGCSSLARSATRVPAALPTQTASPAPTLPPRATTTPQATAAPAASETAAPNPPSATPDSAFETLQASMGSLGILMNGTQYDNPVGTPLPSWQGVPIMAQATAGQEFNPNVYSYVAATTLDQAQGFYQGKVASLGITNPPVTSFGGTGAKASHGVSYTSYKLSILITSYDNDTGHVIVVISKTR
jgi:hypothetical protein